MIDLWPFIAGFVTVSVISGIIRGLVINAQESRAEKAALANGWPSLAICRYSLKLSPMPRAQWPEIIDAHGPYKPPG